MHARFRISNRFCAAVLRLIVVPCVAEGDDPKVTTIQQVPAMSKYTEDKKTNSFFSRSVHYLLCFPVLSIICCVCSFAEQVFSTFSADGVWCVDWRGSQLQRDRVTEKGRSFHVCIIGRHKTRNTTTYRLYHANF